MIVKIKNILIGCFPHLADFSLLDNSLPLNIEIKYDGMGARTVQIIK